MSLNILKKSDARTEYKAREKATRWINRQLDQTKAKVNSVVEHGADAPPKLTYLHIVPKRVLAQVDDVALDAIAQQEFEQRFARFDNVSLRVQKVGSKKSRRTSLVIRFEKR